MDYKSLAQELRDLMKDPNHKAGMDAYFAKLRSEQDAKDRFIDKCIKLITSLNDAELNTLFENFTKHANKRHDIRWDQGVDGESDLCDVVLRAFEKVGTALPNSEYGDFTAAMFEYRGYIAELVVGQGSFIAIYKKD